MRNLGGGRRACSVAIQGSDGKWTTRTGSCVEPSLSNMFNGYCETGLGQVDITSNGGVSHCND
uniref:hypothetical protein n=1 Tax=Chryseobacterium paridis TaxID=2800328 RepID=UPI001F4910BE|nr:hypothetical protein [Chryseobacterium paridis]